MRIYISGTFTAQARLRLVADRLRAMGHDIVGTWLYEPAQPAHVNSRDWNRTLAEKDVAEVFAADCVILDLHGASTTGGRYVEWGLACYPGSMRRRYIVAPPEHTNGVFDHLAHRRFDTWEDLYAYIGMTHAIR